MNAGQKSGSASSLTSGSKIGDLVRAGVGRDGLDSPGHDKSSGVSSYNSEAGGVKSTMITQDQVIIICSSNCDPLFLISLTIYQVIAYRFCRTPDRTL